MALSIAEQFGGEIVNCDSVQLYKYLNIGTAKVPPDQRRGIAHHLIDLLDPDQVFTAGDYARLARRLVSDIAGRGRLPVMVGGTGFYLRAFLHGLSETPVRDESLRHRLAARSPERLHRLLRRLDCHAAERIHPNDTNKVIRAIEVCVQARQPITEVFQANPIRSLEGFRVHKVGIDPDRELLAARINARCVRMFESGLLKEVEGILRLGFSEHSKALQSIGYKEAVQCLRGELSEEQAVERTQTATRQYARRQRTWFRREPEVRWINDFGDAADVQETAKQHLRVVLRS